MWQKWELIYLCNNLYGLVNKHCYVIMLHVRGGFEVFAQLRTAESQSKKGSFIFHPRDFSFMSPWWPSYIIMYYLSHLGQNEKVIQRMEYVLKFNEENFLIKSEFDIMWRHMFSLSTSNFISTGEAELFSSWSENVWITSGKEDRLYHYTQIKITLYWFFMILLGTYTRHCSKK